MKVILTMAISANGMIATKDGEEDFIPHDNWDQIIDIAKKAGGLIWGHKTYKAVITWGDQYLQDVANIKKAVISNSSINLLPGFELVNSPKHALEIFEESGLSQVSLIGGSNINASFAKAGLIDEIILCINPSIVGDGIPLFSTSDFFLPLELKSINKFGNNLVELRYKVLK